MGFVSLCILFMVGIGIASVLTGMLRGFILSISSLGIVYYYMFATPETRQTLDTYAMNFNFSDTAALTQYLDSIKSTIDNNTTVQP